MWALVSFQLLVPLLKHSGEVSLAVYIVTGDWTQALDEPSREVLVWDPSVMDSASDEDGTCV